jgi:dTDP-4-dehydrorhamnose 3,5-epimerase
VGDRLTIERTPIEGLCVVRSRVHHDERGTFSRLFCEDELLAIWGRRRIAQVNHSSTRRRGAVRGLHYQHHPHAETKLVRCLRGQAWDVAVDLRRGSPTFLRWYGQRLMPEDANAMLIPEGFAHGFQALTEDVEMLYCHSAAFVPEAGAGLHALDPRLAITWPLPVTELSALDAAHAPLAADFEGEPA